MDGIDVDAVPEAPAPRPRVYVRDRYKPHGWATPPGNLVAVYLEACERHRVPANSAVIAQLHRRVRLMQSGPWHRVAPPDPPQFGPVPSRAVSPAASQTTILPNHSQLSHVYSQESYGPNPNHVLSPVSSHAAVAAANQTVGELRQIIMAHVHPLPVGAASRPGTGTAGAETSAAVLGPVGSATHAATVSAAALAVASGGLEGPMYSARAVAHVCELVDPRTPWPQQLAIAGLDPSTRVVTEGDFQRLLEAAAGSASLGELRQAALEVLSRPVGHGTLDLEGLVGALFDFLDVPGQGSIPASELRAAVSAFSPAAAADMYAMIEHHPPLARGNAEPVSRSEFVEVLSSLAPGLAPPGSSPAAIRDKAEIAVNSMLDSKIREPFGYDFSRCYLGPRGLLPVLDALSSDATFTSLSLANCGLGCCSVERLVEWLQGHPCLTSLDLTNNLIADRGGMALTRLLTANPRIVELGIGSTYLLPRRPGRTHHDNLGPSDCEDAAPLLEALAANRAARRSAPAEIVRALRQHGPELRAMCYSLLARETLSRNGNGSSTSTGTRNGDGGVGGVGSRSASNGGGSGGGGRPVRPGSSAGGSDGRVPLSALREALGEVTAEWGFTPDALDGVLHHERLLGTATAGRTADDSGRLGVTYDELMQFLRSEDQVVRVAQAVRNHMVEVKQLFFSLALEPATAASITASGVGGPRTALSTVRQAIVAAASQPGSGWDVSEEDLEAVLSPSFLRAHIRAAPTGSSRAPGAAAPGSDGLLVPEWSPLAATASAASVAGGGGVASGRSSAASVSPPPPPDMLISWPELCNTMLYLFNR